MRELNCSAGDLAIVISAHLAENIGQLVEVLGPQTGDPFPLTIDGHVWQVKTGSGQPTLHYRFSDGRTVTLPEGPVPDSRLRRVSGLPVSDATQEAKESSAYDPERMPADSPFAPYSDVVIGMDHPLFMAHMQARMDASMLADAGVPLADALRSTRARMQDLFGSVPLPLVDSAVTQVYAQHAVAQVEATGSGW